MLPFIIDKPLYPGAKRNDKILEKNISLVQRDDNLYDKNTGYSIQDLATFANTSYQPYNATRRAMLKRISPHLKLDTELTDKYTVVARDMRNNNIFINHRGTKPTDTYDLSADLNIIAGTEKKHSRFKQAQEHLEKVKNKYKNANITMTGHSLGGTIAKTLGHDNDNLNVYAFNPGSAVTQLKSNITGNDYDSNSKILNLHIAGDPISLLSQSGNEDALIFKKKGLSSHTLANYLDTNLELI